MKRLICAFLILVLSVFLFACQPKIEPILQPVNFYYRNAQLRYGSDDGLISAQITESASFAGNVLAILNEYLKGPDSDRFSVTFPASTKVLELEFVGSTAYLQMNDSFSRLTGIDLTIACACITKTTIELTGASAVCISAVNESLDGAPSITMDESSLILIDNYTP